MAAPKPTAAKPPKASLALASPPSPAAPFARCLLAFVQFVFARDRQAGQGVAAGDGGRVNVGQQGGKRRCVLPGMGHLRRQRGHQRRFALCRGAGFQGVVKGAHACGSSRSMCE